MSFDILDFEKVVPKPLLEFYVEKNEVEADRRGIETMFNALNDYDSSIVKGLYEDYRYAGRTAVNLFEEITLPSGFMDKDKMVSIIKKELNTSNIFNREFTPPLTNEPQINFVEDRGDTILIQFVAKGRDRRIRNGYEIMNVTTIQSEYAMIHFSKGPTIVELRCAYNYHSKLLTSIERLFQLGMQEDSWAFEWVPVTKVSSNEAEKIASILSAGLVEADHKDDGIYDRHMVTANPDIDDLRKEDEYIQQFKNKMLLSQTLVMSYASQTPYGWYKTDVKFKINLYTGFQFLSKVSEPVIQYVMDVFLDVRYNDGKSYISETEGQQTVS